MNERVNLVTSVGQLGAGFDYRSATWERLSSTVRLSRVAGNEEDSEVAKIADESKESKHRKEFDKAKGRNDRVQPFSAYA
jgi:hypothetical protein